MLKKGWMKNGKAEINYIVTDNGILYRERLQDSYRGIVEARYEGDQIRFYETSQSYTVISDLALAEILAAGAYYPSLLANFKKKYGIVD